MVKSVFFQSTDASSILVEGMIMGRWTSLAEGDSLVKLFFFARRLKSCSTHYGEVAEWLKASSC